MATYVVKKYENRRLYDPAESKYVTLEDLTHWIKRGHDVRVVDAKSGEDLTQSTLVQIIFETRRASRLLPAELLVQLIRLDEDDLAEFLGKYLSFALAAYTGVRDQSQALAPWNPFAAAPFTATAALAQMFNKGAGWVAGKRRRPTEPPAPPKPSMSVEPEPEPEAEPEDARADDLAALRRELEELKRQVGGARPRKKK